MTCKVADMCFNICERVEEVIEGNNSLPLLFCELPVSVQENPDRKINLIFRF